MCYEIQDEAQYNPEIHDNCLKTGITVQSILCRDLTVSGFPARPLSRSALRYAYLQRRRSPRRRLGRQQERHPEAEHVCVSETRGAGQRKKNHGAFTQKDEDLLSAICQSLKLACAFVDKGGHV